MRKFTLGATAVSALALTASGALAGGFEVREQSAYFQGMSFAGAAAGGNSLSAMFWNPAAAGYVGAGLTTNSNYSLILPRSDVTVEDVNLGGGPFDCSLQPRDCSVDVARDAIVPASYAAYRIDSKTVVALGLNSQFGLGTKPDNADWVGRSLASESSKLFSVNVTPTVAYEIAPGITVGAGLQVQWFDLKRFKTFGQVGPLTGTTKLEGDDWGVGWTLGVNFKPAPGTSIGIGFRSSIDHGLEGSINSTGTLGNLAIFPASISADVETPEKVTASFSQALASNMRLMGTVEWTNWSRLGVIPVEGAPSPTALDFQWHDGWYFALGGEYDVNDKLTVRAGGAYEISPIQNASERLVQLPDADRIWLSLGASYKIGNLIGSFLGMSDSNTTLDFAYSHIFVEDADFERFPASSTTGFPLFSGNADSSVDIISVGMTTEW